MQGLLRWTFIVIGALATATVLFSYLYHVNEEFYDPSLFSIGVGGLFCLLCGIMLMVLSRNSRLWMELKRARIRCEELADSTWELKESEARAASLLEAQGDLILRRDNAGRITYANDAYCAFAGRAREALIGTTHALPSLQQGRLGVLPDGTRLRDEQIMAAGGARWLAWRDVVVWTETAEHAEVQSVGRDVTERIEAERELGLARDAAEAASRAKSRFLATVSHEIRTPLNGILGMAGLLLDTPLTPEQTTYVKATKTSGDALLSLIEEILDFSKIEAGKIELELRPFAPAALVEDIVELLGPRAQAKGLEVAADLDEHLPARVIGDATRLRQVLLNLAGNAIKFTETGGVSVVVEAGFPGDIVFEVRDTGIGIAPAQQARIFHEFEQVDGGLARQFGGTGLGLAISRRIVERMGGRIEVDSEAGRGIKLPRHRAAARRRGRRGRRAAGPLRPRRAGDRAGRRRGRVDRAAPDPLGRQRHASRAASRRPVRAAALGRRAGRSRHRRRRSGAARRHDRRPAHRADHAGRTAPAAGAEGSRLRRLSGEADPRRFAQRPARRRVGLRSAPSLMHRRPRRRSSRRIIRSMCWSPRTTRSTRC